MVRITPAKQNAGLGKGEGVAYYIEPVDRSELPPGADWAFVDDGDDIRFIVACGARVELPDDALRFLLARIAEHTEVAEVIEPPEKPVFRVV